MEPPRRVRPPAVAGQFYPDSPDGLRREIEGCYLHPLGPGALPRVRERPLSSPLGLVVPHAGYVYSGPVAARGFSELASRGRPEAAIILGPNHYGTGTNLALSEADAWRTPLGVAWIDQALGRALAERVPSLRPSEAAHQHEHSLEVQVPFLQHLYGEGLRFLPVALLDQTLDTSTALGKAIAEVVRGRGIAVIASTDLSHYHPQAMAQRKDQQALEAMLSLDPAALGRAIRDHDVNMCGPGAVMALLACMGSLGAREARLLGYATSADTGGDRQQVVGYGSLVVGAT